MPLGAFRAGLIGSSGNGGGGGGIPTLPEYSLQVSSATGIITHDSVVGSTGTSKSAFVSCWIKSSSAPSSSTYIIMTHWNSPESPTTYAYSGLKYNTDGTLTFNYNPRDFLRWTMTSVTAINDNAWHHILIVVNRGAGEARIYIDGIQDTSTTFSTSLIHLWQGRVLCGNNSTTMNIKMYQPLICAETSDGFNGILNNTYNAGSPIDIVGLGQYTLTSQAGVVGGDVTKDSIDTLHDWVATGTITASTDIPV